MCGLGDRSWSLWRIGGGEIVAEGTPETIAKHKKSITGTYLKKELERSKLIQQKRISQN